MIVRRWLPYLVAAVLGTGTALLAACGDGPSGGIAADDASQLKSDIDDVQQRVDDARCAALVGQLRQLVSRIDRLGPDVDAQLRERLSEGTSRLRERALTECEENRQAKDTETTTTETQTTTTETTTQPPETTTQPPETTTQPPPTTTAPPPPPEPVPPPPVDPGGGTPPEVGP